MAVNPKTPGVYIDEIPLLPSSVASVATAVPAFIGYVEKAGNSGAYLPFNQPVRITSIVDYERFFGKGESQLFKLDVSEATTPAFQRTVTVSLGAESIFQLYYNVQMYFLNGGGPCYIIPVGFYNSGSGPAVTKAALLAGLSACETVDEPTLLLIPDAVSLSNIAERKDVYDAALTQCNLLKDRFTLMDVNMAPASTVNPNTDAAIFRTSAVGINNLKYGAAYYPKLNTVLNYTSSDARISVNSFKRDGTSYALSAPTITLLNAFDNTLFRLQQGFDYIKRLTASFTPSTMIAAFVGDFAANLNTTLGVLNAAETDVKLALNPAVGTSLTSIRSTAIVGGTITAAINAYTAAQTPTTAGALMTLLSTAVTDMLTLQANAYNALSNSTDPVQQYVIGNGTYLKNFFRQVYQSAQTQISNLYTQVYPSGIMAGIYNRVDSDRGVWKAPANINIRSINGPVYTMTNAEQDFLNVDPTGGKSINAIRPFTGRGTLVWGARTLAGNDSEWRYINVRRLFNYIEESIQKSTQATVFESNNAITWFRVKGMIEGFLTGLWRDGALAGTTAKDAFFVNVGLGTSMIADDILNGRMIIEVGLAASRPAEFIMLKFEHKLQQA